MNFAKTAILLAGMTALFMTIGFLLGGVGGMMIAFVIAAGMNMFAFWRSDKAVLRQQGAELVSRQSHPELVDMVARLAQNADLPMPKVFVMHQDQPNAFATGRNPDNAAVAATTGLLRRMNYDEVEGVMAHELAHIKNRDTLVMTIVATMAGAIGMIANFAFMFRGRNRGAIGMIGAMAAMILAPMAASVVQMAISRTREYSADKLGAEISGNPHGLADALRKIQSFAMGIENPTAEHHPETAHMFIINPLSGEGRDKLFSTHPATQNRIAALEELAQTWEQEGRMSGASPRVETSGNPFDNRQTGRSSMPTSGSGQRPNRQTDRRGPWQ